MTDPALGPTTAPTLSNVRNFRDLGGLPTADGGALRARVLFRSGHFDRMSSAEAEAVRAAGVTTMIDLRSAPERRPNPQLDAFEVVHLGEALFGGHGVDRSAFEQMRAELGPDGGHELMKAAYRTFVGSTHVTASAIRTIADATGGVLIHCSAGKDRTGVLIALILEAVGVRRDAILADYLLSGQPENQMTSETQRQIGLPDDPWYAPFNEAHEPYMEAAWDHLTAEFGDIAGYERALGLDDAVRTRLRDRLLGG